MEGRRQISDDLEYAPFRTVLICTLIATYETGYIWAHVYKRSSSRRTNISKEKGGT